MNTLPEPYQTQVGNKPNNDCGAAAILMKAQSYKLALDMSVEQVYFQILPGGGRGLYMGELTAWLNQRGLACTWQIVDTPEKLFTILSAHKPTTFLINYGTWVDAHLSQFSNFRGGHFIEANGMDLDSVYVHDPDRDDGKGTFEPIPINTFFLSLRNCGLDQNPQYMGLVPTIPISDLSKPVITTDTYRVVAANGVNVRKTPYEVTGNIVGYLGKEAVIHIASYNSSGYCQITEGIYKGFYVWGPLVQRVAAG